MHQHQLIEAIREGEPYLCDSDTSSETDEVSSSILRFLSKLMAKGKLLILLLIVRSPKANNALPLSADLNLALSASKDAGVPLPVGSLTSTLYNKLSGHDDYAGRDFSVVYEYLKEGMQGGVADQIADKLKQTK